MDRHHFISYSPSDGQAFAIQLCDTLAAGPAPYLVWLDKRQLRPGSASDDRSLRLSAPPRVCSSHDARQR